MDSNDMEISCKELNKENTGAFMADYYNRRLQSLQEWWAANGESGQMKKSFYNGEIARLEDLQKKYAAGDSMVSGEPALGLLFYTPSTKNLTIVIADVNDKIILRR